MAKQLSEGFAEGPRRLSQEEIERLRREVAPSTSENQQPFYPVVVEEVTYIEPQPASVLEKVKALGPDAVYVLQELLLSDSVSDKVRLDAVKAVFAIVEAEKNKELTVVAEGAADLDELERLIREGGFDL